MVWYNIILVIRVNKGHKPVKVEDVNETNETKKLKNAIKLAEKEIKEWKIKQETHTLTL